MPGIWKIFGITDKRGLKVAKRLNYKVFTAPNEASRKIGKRKGKRFYEAERFSKRYPKQNAFLTPAASIAAFCGDLLVKA